MNAAVIVAAGESTRMGREKSLLRLHGREVLRWCVEAFEACSDVHYIVVVTSPSRLEEVATAIATWGCQKPYRVVPGGKYRGESVYNGLSALPEDCGIVAIHDGARPFIDQGTIQRTIDSALEKGSGVAGIATTDTIKIVDKRGCGCGTLERDSLLRVQTPQTFRYELILKAYQKAQRDGFQATDDSAIAEYDGHQVYFVQGSEVNIKLTRPEDLAQGEAILNTRLEEKQMMRSGIGYDAHRLVSGRKLILGGVEIPHSTGLLGHSDADVLVHAIMDALLGAAAMGDIGKLFPDNDTAFEGISSLLLLERVGEALRQANWRVVNIDSVIVAQKPKLMEYIPEMAENIAKSLDIKNSAVSVKATTTERMGYEGREEGISAQAIAIIAPYANPMP